MKSCKGENHQASKVKITDSELGIGATLSLAFGI